MKNKLLALFMTFLVLVPNLAKSQTSTPSIVMCESYSTSGVPSGINDSWKIKKTGGYVYILYSNGRSAINTKNTLWLYIDKKNSSGEYKAYATEKFEVKSGDKFSVYDYKFTEAGQYKIEAYQDGKYLATNYATISYQDESSSTTSFSADKNASIVTCESYDDNGNAKGIYKAWDITDEANRVYIHFKNGTTPVGSSASIWLYVDKKGSDGKYAPYGTEKFTFKSGQNWSVYDFQFKDAGEYKISAMSNLEAIATSTVTINKKSSSSSSTINTSNNYSTTKKDKNASIVACSDYNKNTGEATDVFSVWNITEESYYIYLLYKNGNTKVNTNNTVYLYVDKKGTNGKYSPYGTEKFTFESGKNWSVFDFPFKDAGEYKISAMQNLEELAVNYITVKTKNSSTSTSINTSGKKIVTCTDFDTYGKPSGVYSVWNIQQGGSYVYALFDNAGSKINGTLWLYVDKKDEKTNEYYAFDTKTYEHDNKSWASYKYTFTEPGEYQISAVSSKGKEATTYVTVKFADGVKIETKKDNCIVRIL